MTANINSRNISSTYANVDCGDYEEVSTDSPADPVYTGLTMPNVARNPINGIYHMFFLCCQTWIAFFHMCLKFVINVPKNYL